MLYYTILYYTTLYYTIHFEHLLGVWLLSRGIFNVLTNFPGKIGFMKSHSRAYNIQF